MKFLRVLFVLFLVLGPASAQELVDFPRDHLEIVGQGGHHHSFNIELAVTPQQQTQGLMYRRSLAPDAGMLFDFHQTKSIAMWMKNTFIPLDMIFIADDGRIVGIAERTIPQSQDIISSPGAIRAVLEVNGGTASRQGIAAGDRIVFAGFGSIK